MAVRVFSRIVFGIVITVIIFYAAPTFSQTQFPCHALTCDVPRTANCRVIKDEFGCPTCKSICEHGPPPCPQQNCSYTCPDGYQTDQNGCPTCTCAEPTTTTIEQLPPSILCAWLYCVYQVCPSGCSCKFKCAQQNQIPGLPEILKSAGRVTGPQPQQPQQTGANPQPAGTGPQQAVQNSYQGGAGEREGGGFPTGTNPQQRGQYPVQGGGPPVSNSQTPPPGVNTMWKAGITSPSNRVNPPKTPVNAVSDTRGFGPPPFNNGPQIAAMMMAARNMQSDPMEILFGEPQNQNNNNNGNGFFPEMLDMLLHPTAGLQPQQAQTFFPDPPKPPQTLNPYMMEPPQASWFGGPLPIGMDFPQLGNPPVPPQQPMPPQDPNFPQMAPGINGMLPQPTGMFGQPGNMFLQETLYQQPQPTNMYPHPTTMNQINASMNRNQHQIPYYGEREGGALGAEEPHELKK